MKRCDKNWLDGVQRLHFIGIGGSGTYPLVEILHAEGYTITGSDNNTGDNIDKERAMGITVHMGHAAQNIGDAQLVVYSAAIHPDNVERQEAMRRGIPCIERSELLGLLTRRYNKAICVAGTHGKTTTSAMITQMLLTGGYDPAAVIGGKLPMMGGSGRAGKSDYMVVEACEYAHTFLHLSPDVGLILNIDADHLEYFGSFENVLTAFVDFAGLCRTVVLCGDDRGAMQARPRIKVPVVTYGWGPDRDFYPENIAQSGPFHTEFDLMHQGRKLGRYTLKVAGRHNLLNAVAALASAITAGAEPAALTKGLATFTGAGRRFEKVAEVGGITVVDDYAHHPAELQVTLEMAAGLGYNRVWAVFQPFTYSRTAMLIGDFARVLSLADRVVISPIMGGREQNTYGITDHALPDRIPGSHFLPGFEAMADFVAKEAQPGDLVLTMGCGDIYKCARMIAHRLEAL